MTLIKDETEPGEKWEFDGSVTAAFDDMLARSIPQYEVMRKACYDLACRFQRPKTDIVDVGCSRGEAMAALIDRFGAQNRYVGLEVSKPMIEAARARFSGLINTGVVQIKEHDLRQGYPALRSSVTLCILTLQFTPIEYRLRILHDIYNTLIPGGAFILVEKVLGYTAEIDKHLVDIYYNLKAENGYSMEQIERKRLSLEGVLVPLPSHMNEQLLKATGFSHIDYFWRWMNFAGWIAIKGAPTGAL